METGNCYGREENADATGRKIVLSSRPEDSVRGTRDLLGLCYELCSV